MTECSHVRAEGSDWEWFCPDCGAYEKFWGGHDPLSHLQNNQEATTEEF